MRLSGYQKQKPPVHLEPWHHYLHGDPSERENTLKLLSYNIQVGIHTRRYHDYLLRSWQHFLPHHRRENNLQQIAELIRHFDLIALQEVDGGSFRSQFTNQIHYLAKAADKQFWHQQLNRNLGRMAQHSNGVIGDVTPVRVSNHALPGIKGRGAIAFELGEKDPLIIVIAHLALGKKHQDLQLKYIRNIIRQYNHAIIMGDLNTDSLRILYDSPLHDCGLKASHARATYPSWQPSKCLDQILVSQHIIIHKVGVLDFMMSDHLPVAIEIELPNA
ncbi:endonuclease/exonuclease/phosphatase family protein [Reinekea blandensis]|uniref:Endonuclease/exonuclease/phosphatase family protein n=1 Tax=Reinekea blandensis MED297 TaxID=314283 RepID=A4BD75_9GAMM|nr:endonuclease/exonuclease/phosphatase family protein [Reinekea blandensis]EAR09819.1 endonuclease/exonuclease/phosphatase family protein [Reinekea sp. MED297] [Reinekea blandensis MED297]